MGRPLVAGALGALAVILLGVVAWARGPAGASRPPPPVVRATVVGPGQAACCWTRRATWYADPAHGYPGFAGPTYWGCKPKPPKILSPEITARHDSIQVDQLPIVVEGVMPFQRDFA